MRTTARQCYIKWWALMKKQKEGSKCTLNYTTTTMEQRQIHHQVVPRASHQVGLRGAEQHFNGHKSTIITRLPDLSWWNYNQCCSMWCHESTITRLPYLSWWNYNHQCCSMWCWCHECTITRLPYLSWWNYNQCCSMWCCCCCCYYLLLLIIIFIIIILLFICCFFCIKQVFSYVFLSPQV